jgi:DNA ligase-1
MKSPHEIIAQIEAVSGRLEKEAIIKAAAESGNKEFFEGMRLAFDSMVTFGVKKVPERDGPDGAGVDWDSFSLILTGFINRSFTGHLGRDTLAELMSNCTNAQWNGWYRRILIKDMRAGFSESTVNKVVGKKYPQYAIPVFSCQLAHDSANHETKVAGQKLIEVKLDGVRVITIVYPDGRVDQFSRNGKELVNFPHVKEQFEAIIKEGGVSKPTVFDGEIMSSSFQDLMKQVHRKSNVKANDAILNLFDIIPLDDFEKGICKTPQETRSMFLNAWYTTWEDKLPNVAVVGQEVVDLDTVAGQKRYKEINQKAIDGGYEGIMLKEPKAPYEVKRSVAWLKLKPFIEVSLSVIGVEEGTGKNEGKMGALICEGDDGGTMISVNVGSGFSDKQREEFWAGRNKLLGNIAEVRADAITMNQDGTYSLRFPRFKGFRGFVPGEKL